MTIAQAQALLAQQRRSLRTAISLLKRSRIGRRAMGEHRELLRKVSGFERDMNISPEFHAPLVLGFMGENGWAPLIRHVCRTAPKFADHSLRS